jgi:(2R)-sulfolactate sulfo-lyase subunit alpha
VAYRAIAHKKGDAVAVAVADLSARETVDVRLLDGSPSQRVVAREAIPLGHKIALQDMTEGTDVIEYGERIGRAVRPIATGEYVHVHNVKSARWPA